MPTTFIFRPVAGSITSTGARYLSQRAAASDIFIVTNTVASGTNIQVTDGAGGTALTWYSEPITTQVTISGSITVNIRGRESANTVNAAAGILIQRGDNSGAVLSTIVADTIIGAEYGTADANRSANVTPTSTTMNVGERIIALIKVRNVGTMGAGTVTNTISGAPLRSYLTFTEDIVTDEILNTPIYTIFGSNGYIG